MLLYTKTLGLTNQTIKYTILQHKVGNKSKKHLSSLRHTSQICHENVTAYHAQFTMYQL